MKWHFWNKTIFRKLVMLFSGFMGAILLAKANLIEAKGIHEFQEINCFIDEYFIKEIKPAYNLFYGALILVGMGLVLFGWKRCGNRYRDGIWLNNIGTALLATAFMCYGITNMSLLHVVSWDGVCAFVISAIMYIIFVKDVINYTKNKKIYEEDRNIKKVAIAGIIAVSVIACATGVFAVNYRKTWDDNYETFRAVYADKDYGFIGEEEEYENYLRLQYVNYFNPEGKTFTYEELKKSIDNYNSKEGSWYTLWYCCECMGENENDSAIDASFSSYGYGNNSRNFMNFVNRKLKSSGIRPSEATFEQIDEACKYIYDVYVNQTPMEIIGDIKGDIVIDVAIPEDGDVNGVVVTGDGKRYGGNIPSWYEVSSIGQKSVSGADQATVLEAGKVYVATINVSLALPYFCHEDAKVDITGIDYEKVEVSSYRDAISIAIWIIPGNNN